MGPVRKRVKCNFDCWREDEKRRVVTCNKVGWFQSFSFLFFFIYRLWDFFLIFPLFFSFRRAIERLFPFSSDLPPPKLFEQTQMGTHPTMALSKHQQVPLLKAPAILSLMGKDPTLRPSRKTSASGRFFSSGGRLPKTGEPDPEEGVEGGSKCSDASRAAAACIGVWIGRAGVVFSAAAASRDRCEDVWAPANFIICA